MLEATLCFLLRGDPPEQILLGYKKIGFGKGKYGGAGGKLLSGESAVRAAVRELYEETGIQTRETDLRPMAHLTFLFPYRPGWSQVVHVFVTGQWEGEAVESREIVPEWFAVSEIPYCRMWADCQHWLPPVLRGERVKASFTFSADNETIGEMQVDLDGRA